MWLSLFYYFSYWWIHLCFQSAILCTHKSEQINTKSTVETRPSAWPQFTYDRRFILWRTDISLTIRFLICARTNLSQVEQYDFHTAKYNDIFLRYESTRIFHIWLQICNGNVYVLIIKNHKNIIVSFQNGSYYINWAYNCTTKNNRIVRTNQFYRSFISDNIRCTWFCNYFLLTDIVGRLNSNK